MWFIFAGILGVICGIIVPYNLSLAHVPYIAVALIAALDSICGAFLANLNKKFNMNVLLTGLVSNAILAVALTYVGTLLGIELYFVVMIVFGVRIFNNVAAIRRITADIYFHKKDRKKEQIKRRELKAADAAETAIDAEFESDLADESDSKADETIDSAEEKTTGDEEKKND